MSNSLFGYMNRFLTAVLTGTAGIAGLGLDQLQNDQGSPATAWQVQGTSATARLNAGAVVPWRAFALTRVNLTSQALVRWRVGTVDSLDEVAPVVGADLKAGAIPSGFTFTRASPTTGFDAAGNFLEIASGAPRWVYDATGARLGLQMEPARTNRIRNPRGEATAGDTAIPIYWTSAVAVGSSVAYSRFIEKQRGAVRYTYSGTVTTQGYIGGILDNGATAAQGETLTFSVWLRWNGTIPAGSNFRVRMNERGSSTNLSGDTFFTPTGDWQFITGTYKVTGADATTMFAQILCLMPVGTVMAHSIDFHAPQLELGSIATSRILPAVGARVTSDRAADLLEAAVASTAQYSLYADATTIAIESAYPGGAAVSLTGSGVTFAQIRSTNASTPYVDGYIANNGTVVADSANRLTPLGTRVRQVLSVSGTAYAFRVNGAVADSGNMASAPTVTKLSVSAGNTVFVLGETRVYNPTLSPGRATGLSNNGQAVEAAAYDSGWISAGVVRGYGRSVLALAAAVAGQYCQVEISDPTNPDGFLNVPLAYAGDARQPARPIAYESSFGRDDSAQEVVTRGGQEFVSLDWQKQFFDISHQSLGPDEVWSIVDEMEIFARQGGNVLFIPDPDGANRNRETIFGRLKPTAAVTYPYQGADRRSWRGRITERI